MMSEGNKKRQFQEDGILGNAEDLENKGAGEEMTASESDAEENPGEDTEENKEEDTAEISEKEAAETQEEEDMQSKYLRLAADFQNFKRRVDKEKNDIYSYANEKFAVDLLEVIDNFERAILHSEDSVDKGMKEGMEMIFKQLLGVLEKNNIEEIKAEGEEFDPNFHNAVMMENSAEHESGKVSKVLQKGYLLNGKVIRPTMVKVAQ